VGVLVAVAGVPVIVSVAVLHRQPWLKSLLAAVLLLVLPFEGMGERVTVGMGSSSVTVGKIEVEALRWHDHCAR